MSERFAIKEKKYKFTDQGNAELFCNKSGDVARYHHAANKWMLWDGKKWKFDEIEEVHKLATEALKSLYGEAENSNDPEKCIETGTWANRSMNIHRINSMLSLARALMPMDVEKLDSHPMLFNTESGIIDLNTGELLDHTKDRLLSKLSPAAYDPTAECPRWMSFLEQIMSDDLEVIRYLQKVVGYALTGRTDEQCMFILYGNGANGKSTFINVLMHILGDYGLQTPTETLMVKRSEGVRNDIARLCGTRLVSATEGERNQALAESLIKQLTGGDKVATRFMYQEFFEFIPEFKVFFTTNYKPTVKGADYGIWRRLRPIPFDVRIPEDQRDPNLESKLIKESPGILRWAIEGALLWQQEGLSSPQVVEDALRSYKSEMDVLTEFVETECVTSPGSKIKKSELRAVYVEFCERNGSKPLSNIKLKQELIFRGLQEQEYSDGSYWMNLSLSKNLSGVNGDSGANSVNPST